MKKLVALAVAGAFVAPVYAADVSVSGSQEFSYKDVNGTTTFATDANVDFTAKTETATGLAVTAYLPIDAMGGGTDGGETVTVAGPFGTVQLGDVSSAADKYDDRNDYDKVLGTSLTALDASLGWTLPTTIDGLSVYVSYAAENNDDSTAVEHSGVALSYKAGPVAVAYGLNENADDTKTTYVGGTFTMAGLAVSIENMENTGSTKTDESSIGLKYTMGDLVLWMSSQETKEDDVVDSDITSYGIHYNMGGGVTGFYEMRDDDRSATAGSSALGVVFSF